MEEDSEITPLLRGGIRTPTTGITKVYRRRWYILFIFSMLALVQTMVWNTWGPIADTAGAVYGWTQSDFAMLNIWGSVTYATSMFFYSWLMESKGLRVAMLVSGVWLFLGTAIRCIPVPLGDTIWVMHVGQIGIGLSGPVVMAASPVVSAAWFPPHQRTTATAIGAIAPIVGVAMSFLIGPQLVHNVDTRNASTVSPLNESTRVDGYFGISPEQKHKHMLEINRLMYLGSYCHSTSAGLIYETRYDICSLKSIMSFIEFAISGVFFFASILYFPKRPPLPPSLSASRQRQDFFAGFKALCMNKQFMGLALAYAIFTGVYIGWTTELTLILNSIGVDQDSAGWMGFSASVAGFLGGLIFGRLVDLTGGKIMKLVLLSLTVASLGIRVWIVLICGKYIPFNTVDIGVSYIATGFFGMSLTPLFFEICAEGAYPVSEGSTTGFITWLSNVVCLIFLLVATVESLGYAWMNWAMLGSAVLIIPLLLMYEEHYIRLEIDVASSPE